MSSRAPAPTLVIVGSGPAGVSAAWPLVEAGLDVAMLDASDDRAMPHSPSGTVGTFRRSSERAGLMFGSVPPIPGPPEDRSPKLATPLARAVTAHYEQRIGLNSSGFSTSGSLARGGLSNIWGAAALRFEDVDLARFPGGIESMHAAYNRVAARIGMAGGISEFTPPIRSLLDRQVARDDGFTLAPATNAVLETPLADRDACNHCGLCLWGCDRRSIYNSAYELSHLERHPNFSYRGGHAVRAVRPTGNDGHILELEDREVTISASHVVLAAGTIATTGLALQRLAAFNIELPLFTNPVAAAAFILPGLFGAALPERSFSLAQLQYSLTMPDHVAVGMLYGSDTLPLGVVADRLPFSRPLALRFARALTPALILATCYLPGRFSRNSLRLEKSDPQSIVITGRQAPEARACLIAATRRLSGHLRRRSAYRLPGSVTISKPGADAHYAGTLPMGGDGAYACSGDGELNACRNLFIADGACLPVLPAQHCTLTIMANADRIGRGLARRLVAQT